MPKPQGVVGVRNQIDMILSPIVLLFHKIGISANHITLLQGLPIMICFLLLVQKSYVWATVFLAISLFLDVLDGAWARITKNMTKKGHILDKVFDLFGIYTFLLGIAVAREREIAMLVLALGIINAILYIANEFYKPELYCGVRTFGFLGLVFSNLGILLTISLVLGIIMLAIKPLKVYFSKNRQMV